MKYIGHRGFRKRYAENTLPGFQAVIEYGKYSPAVIGIELDIHLTAEGRIAVLHDTSLPCDGKKTNVCDLSFSEVRKIVLDRNRRPDGLVPTLDETLVLVNHQVALYLEIKDAPYNKPRFADELGRLLRAYNPHKDIVLHSFSPELVDLAVGVSKKLDVEYGFLFTKLPAVKSLTSPLQSALDYFHPHYSLLLTQAEEVLDLGLPVNTWTVNSKGVLRALRRLPPDRMRSIMTDDLGLAQTEEPVDG